MADRAARKSSRQAAARPRESARAERLRGVPGYLAEEGPPQLDRLVHERIRLGILSALAVNRSLRFTDLKALLRTSDGNLSVHARKLEDAGYVGCHKGFEGRQPRTSYQLTAKGRRALERYLDHMEAVIHAMRGDST